MIKKLGKEFVATPMSLLHIFCQIVFTKSSVLGLTVRSKTIGPATIFGFQSNLTCKIIKKREGGSIRKSEVIISVYFPHNYVHTSIVNRGKMNNQGKNDEPAFNLL